MLTPAPQVKPPSLVPDLRGHTLATDSADGLRGHVTSEQRVDGVEEAGLPSAHRPHQQHAGLGHTTELRPVLLDHRHQFLFLPAERQSLKGK